MALSKLAVHYSALALAPVKKPGTIHASIRRRVTLMCLGDWDPLFAEPSPCLPAARQMSSQHSDPGVSQAAQAELILAKTRSRRWATAALRAPVNPISPTPGAKTTASK